MRKSTPVARISASTLGSIRPGSGGGATAATSAGRFSHWAALKTVNRFRNGIAGRFLAGLAGASLLVVRHEAVGIDDGGAVLALAHIAAERERLAKGQPALGGEAVLDHGAPEDQDVDPRILPAGGGVLRHGERRLRRRRPPGLDPGHAAGLQLGDDLAGDFVIEARPVVAGASASGLVWTSRISATGAGGLSSSPQPVTANPVRTLTLGGVAGCPRRRGRPRRQARPQGKAFP